MRKYANVKGMRMAKSIENEKVQYTSLKKDVNDKKYAKMKKYSIRM